MDYSRQELVIGKENQEKLRKKKVAIVGVGALGSVVSNLLARAGVNLVLIDRDFVDESNLQRQILFDKDDVGKLKVRVAEERLREVNPDIKIESYAVDLDSDNADLLNSDLVVDCLDNLETRFLVNEYCKKNEIKWIHTSAIKQEGYVWNITDACFRCVFRQVEGLETCETAGVLNSITNLIGSVAANEAIKRLLNLEYEREMMYFNLEKNIFRKFNVRKREDCEVCNGKYEYLEGKKKEMVKFCGAGYFQIKGKYDYNALRKRAIIDNKDFIVLNEKVTVFRERALIKAKTKEEAKSLYSKYIGD